MRKLLLALCALAASPVHAAPTVRPSMADSFRLGTGGDTLCQVQRSSSDPVASGLFDRGYGIVCRDASAPIGRLYALRDDRSGTVQHRLDDARKMLADCRDDATVALADAGQVAVRRCRTIDGIAYDILSIAKDRSLFVAEGLDGYRSALELGLRTIVADRIVAGDITIAITNPADAAGFARVQAGSLDPALALAEGYRRNNSGSYAEASEFFDTLLQRTAGATGAEASAQRGEYLVNRALQQSDLGNVAEAEALFAQATAALPPDPVSLRQLRNYRALDLLNRRQPADALALLDAPLPTPDATASAQAIDQDMAVALNERGPLAAQLGIGHGSGLTPAEKAAALDAQADTLRGSILRGQHRPADASAALDRAGHTLDGIRGGRVASVARLRAQVMTERAAIAEDAGKLSDAQALLSEARAVIALEYPASFAYDAASARLAAFLARHGKTDDALALYRTVVTAMGAEGGASGGFAELLDPYFALLVANLPKRPALGDDLFVASQVLLRPGVADTQATLARELSGGSGEAGRLFRESLNQARSANVLRLELGRLLALPTPTAEDRAGIVGDRGQLAAIETEQVATQAKLARFPAYRAIATQSLTLADLRAVLQPGDAYWKLSVVGQSIYALLVTPDQVVAWKVPFGPGELNSRVDAIRATIALIRDGQTVTPPFDAIAARALYVALAGPAATALPKARHLIFEPDGAMQRLPVGLLIADQPGVDRYVARTRLPKADPFDLTGIDWLGRHAMVSVALSARAFRDLRQMPASQAAGTYLGFGQNAPVAPFLQLTGYAPSRSVIDCRWPLQSWSHPIAATELLAAQRLVGVAHSDVVTGKAFTDTDITSRDDLSRYRVVHFATHGLVVAPRAQCPAQPALLTSFGGKGSDGLLSFSDIYRLHFDADFVILSACDTAGSADVAATRAAGVVTGGGSALDGLVRAFIGAGSRSVLASHWPAPDSFGATEHLIEGLFTAPPGTPAAAALRTSQIQLMDAAQTSHPYYWAGFALIGDGERPVLRTMLGAK